MTRTGRATLTDIAAIYGVTPDTVYRWAREHGIQPVGRRWKAHLYDPNDFLAVRPPTRRTLRKGWRVG